MWIPNVLSSLRIVAALIFPFSKPGLMLPITIFALLTEYLDGMLARKFHWETELGRFMDPFADKVFAFSVSFTILATQRLLPSEFILLLARDILVGMGFVIVLIAYRDWKPLTEFRPNMAGKITTVLQYAVFFAAFMAPGKFNWLVYPTAALGSVSAFVYIFVFLNRPKQGGTEKESAEAKRIA